MKLTKEKLKEIIKEEVESLLREEHPDDEQLRGYPIKPDSLRPGTREPLWNRPGGGGVVDMDSDLYKKLVARMERGE